MVFCSKKTFQEAFLLSLLLQTPTRECPGWVYKARLCQVLHGAVEMNRAPPTDALDGETFWGFSSAWSWGLGTVMPKPWAPLGTELENPTL